ncbi:lactoylglutathione lyase [Kushneria sinocarnis]|uniref:lactoylglutathione lyase n=1 Tax=Kushneria sinocarnis TaxID=595502 RepID=A0A420WWB2_9GAMM|nr:lactoylglutathione lyase [Kushneria sinocarnis]RKR03401.1 lactoylglutathione lyase [Kushneria sinocarnis]
MSTFTENAPGVAEQSPDAAAGFTLNHSMLRVKDPERSLYFYTHVFGMRLLRKLEFPEMQFTLYFLTRLLPEDSVPEDPDERTVWTFSQRGLLELTHNWGTEDDPDFAYHNGNDAPQGFGHICFSVPNLESATTWFEDMGVEFVKRPGSGKMPDIAFVKDPDGYWIEIVQPELTAGLGR